jgi:hypothetical protein
MGNRSYIQIDSKQLETSIVFYGHWSGDDNLTAVKNVLGRTTRIGDPTYLAAQIFYEFATLGNYNGELSFGIDTGLAGGEWPLSDGNPTVVVDADSGLYSLGDKVYTEFVQHPAVVGF